MERDSRCHNGSNISLVASLDELQRLMHELDGVERLAVDVEGNGMFAYRASLCTIQLGWETKLGSMRIAIIDTLSIPPVPLSNLLCNPHVLKVFHDLRFDAQILSSNRVRLQSVRDTAVAAEYLGKQYTGLAALLRDELGVRIDKGLQNSDWAARPLSEESITYLAGDVLHLLRLENHLFTQVQDAGISGEVATETDYRLIEALDTTPAPTEPYLRIKATDKLNNIGWRVLVNTANTREKLAVARNLPPQMLVGDEALIAIAQRPPRSELEFYRNWRVKRLYNRERAMLYDSIKMAITNKDGQLDNVPRREKSPPIPIELRIVRKALEKRLQNWRKAEAEQRCASQQVVLPSHCIRRLIGNPPKTIEQIASLPGLGASRSERYATTLLAILQEPVDVPSPADLRDCLSAEAP